MRTAIVAAVALLSSGTFIPPAHALGCLSGAAAGALAGHMAHHGVLGAVGGCVAAHEWHKHQLREQDLQSRGAYDTRRRQYDLSAPAVAAANPAGPETMVGLATVAQHPPTGLTPSPQRTGAFRTGPVARGDQIVAGLRVIGEVDSPALAGFHVFTERPP